MFTEGDFISSGIGVNIFRFLVTGVTAFLSFIVRDELRHSDDKLLNISVNLCIVQACIMFLGLFGTANYFARMANYFLIFQCIALPYLVEKYFVSESDGILSMKTMMIAGYSGYFIYAEAILFGGFDALHSGISFNSFLSLLV